MHCKPTIPILEKAYRDLECMISDCFKTLFKGLTKPKNEYLLLELKTGFKQKTSTSCLNYAFKVRLKSNLFDDSPNNPSLIKLFDLMLLQKENYVRYRRFCIQFERFSFENQVEVDQITSKIWLRVYRISKRTKPLLFKALWISIDRLAISKY